MHFQGVFCTVAFATLASAAVAQQVPTPGWDKYADERSDSSPDLAAREAAPDPEPMPEPQPYAEAAAWEAAHSGPPPSYAWTTDADTYPTPLATHAANWAAQLSSLAANAMPTGGVKNAARAVADAVSEGLPGASDEDEDYEFDEAWHQSFLDEHGELAFDPEDSGVDASKLRARDAEPEAEADAPVDYPEEWYGDLYTRDVPGAEDEGLGLDTSEDEYGDIYARDAEPEAGADIDYSEEGYGDIYARDADVDYSEEGYGDLYARDIPDAEDTSLGLDTSSERYDDIYARDADIDYSEEGYGDIDNDDDDDDEEEPSFAKRAANAMAQARNIFIPGKGIHQGLVRGAKHNLNARDMENFESGEEYEAYFGDEDLAARDVEDYNDDEYADVPDADEALLNDLGKRDVDDDEQTGEVDVDLKVLYDGMRERDVEDDGESVPDLEEDEVDYDALYGDSHIEVRNVEEPEVDIDLAQVEGEVEDEKAELEARDAKTVEPIMRHTPINVGASHTVKFSTLTREGTRPTEKKGWFW